MAITNQNFSIYRGDSEKIAVALTQADGTPFDKTLGTVFRWRMTKSPYATEDEVIVRKSSDDGGINLTDDGVEIVLLNADTDALLPGIYYHEMKAWDGNDTATVMTGNAIVKPSVKMGNVVQLGAADLVVDTKLPTL